MVVWCTHGQRPTLLIKKKNTKNEGKKRQISCRQLMFCDPLETRPELSIKQTYYYGRTVDVMTEY